MPSPEVQKLLQAAEAAHASGDLARAIRLYGELLQKHPKLAEALAMLAVALAQTGDVVGGIQRLQEAVALEPHEPRFLANLGAVLQQDGDLEEAESAFRRALALDEDVAVVHSNLSAILFLRGDLADARHHAERAVSLAPNLANAHFVLGQVALAERALEPAERSLRTALSLRPSMVEATFELAEVLRFQGRLQESVALNLEALARAPNHVPAYNSVGLALQEVGNLEKARDYFLQGLERAPDQFVLLSNAAACTAELARYEEAISLNERALKIRPDIAGAWSNLGNALVGFGALDRAVAAYRHSLKLEPNSMSLHSNLIFILDLLKPRAEGVALRREFGQRFRDVSSEARVFENPKTLERRLRVGYVSADFRSHSASDIFSKIVLGHDRNAFDVTLYSGVVRRDAVTERYEQAGPTYVPCLRMSDEALLQRILSDRIDVLVDLSAHTEGNRLGVFAKRAAPVQVTAWGHALGTGLPAMDYFFADAVSVPDHEHSDFIEEVVYLPALFCYEPPAVDIGVSPLPCLEGRPFTFGCINRIEKASDATIELWCRILDAVPESRLVIKATNLGDAGARQATMARFMKHGADPHRIVCLGRTSRTEHLKVFAQVDLALDPFPHGGGTSTVESFWMGVPIIARLGRGIIERQGVAFSRAVGLDAFVAQSNEGYLERAVHWAERPHELAEVRAGLRSRLLASPLGDGPAYVRAVEDAYRWMMQRWIAAQPS